MARKIGMLLLALVCVLALAGCSCDHVWRDATCCSPVVCEKCGESHGEPLAHNLSEATCDAPATCSVCGAVEGEAAPHQWILEECTGFCALCGADDPTAPGHKWQEATCDDAKICTGCNLTEGEALGHDMTEATCESHSYCARCGYVDWIHARPLEHTLEGGKYTDTGMIRKTGVCETCGKAVEYFFHRDKVYAWTTFDIASDGSHTNPVTYVRTAANTFKERGEFVRIQWYEDGKLVSPAAVKFDDRLTCHAFCIDGKVYYHTTNQFNNAEYTRKVLLDTASKYMSYDSYRNERYGDDKYDDFALLYLLDAAGNQVGLVRTAYDIERNPFTVVYDDRTGEAWLETGAWKY